MSSTIQLFCAYLFFISTAASASEIQTAPITQGEQVSFYSKALEQQVTLQIQTPKTGKQSNKSYPVLYVFDGQLWFSYSASLTALLQHYETVPPLMVVGISFSDKRFGLFNQPERISRLLRQEVFTRIESEWPVSAERLLFGWQFAGAAILDQATEQDRAAQGFFAASPFPLNDNRLSRLQSPNGKEGKQPLTLLFSSATNEHQVFEGTTKLKEVLAESQSSGFRWRFLPLAFEQSQTISHRFSPMDTLYQGLRFYFDDYAELEFTDQNHFEHAGGIEHVVAYYRNRGEKYGLPSSVSDDAVFNLLRMAMRAPNITLFHSLMQRFATTGFLDQINLGWGMQYGQFYLQHARPQHAAQLYQQLLNRFPNSPRIYKAMGDAAKAQKTLQLAVAHYRQAVQLSQTQDNANHGAYENALESLLRQHPELK